MKDIFEECEEYKRILESRLRKNPKDSEALIHLGFLEFDFTHDHEKSLAYLEKAIEIDPNNLEAYFWLAYVHYADFCEYSKAENVLLKALKIDPHHTDCLLLMALIYWDWDRPLDEAIKYLERALKHGFDRPLIYHILSTLHLKQGNIDLAELYLYKGLEFAQHPPKIPTNVIEKYYENVLTGRSWKDLEKTFRKLEEKIERKKQELKNC